MKKTLQFILLGALVIAGAAIAERQWLRKGAAGGSAKTNLPAAPDFTALDLQGKKVSLSDFRGKVVLINFWATWCGPCRHEIPALIELQEKYRERGLVVLGLSMDEEGKSVVAPWIDRERFEVNGQRVAVNYPILLANDEIAGQFGGLLGLPTSLMISRDGKITRRYIGPATLEKFAKEVEANL